MLTIKILAHYNYQIRSVSIENTDIHIKLSRHNSVCSQLKRTLKKKLEQKL